MEKILEWLKENLTTERYNHSVGTAQFAKNLAKELNIDENKAYIAGLLHDCAKCFPDEKMLEILDKCEGISVDERSSYKTWHAPVSCYVAKNTFKIKDKEILSAIRWHTIGKKDMTDFEKIIFLADKAELCTREEEHAQPIREAIKNDGLNKAMLVCYKQTIKSLIDRDFLISIATIDIYNYLQRLTNVN